jgi:hypothetical protein
LQLVWADFDPAERHEGQMAIDETLLDCGELRLVGFDIDVYILKLADLFTVEIEQLLAVPLGDVPLGLWLRVAHRLPG